MFDPTETQRILKADAKAIKATWIEAHRSSFTMWYGYLVAVSTTLQSGMPGFIPAKLQYWILGAATIILFADKLRRSKPNVV